jgi:hypothetical protein
MSLAGTTGSAWAALYGAVSRPVNAVRLGERPGPARPAARARPLDGVVPAARRTPGPPTRHLRQGPGRLAARLCQGPGQLCRRRQPLAGTLTRCHDCANPALPAPAAGASSPVPGMPATGSGRKCGVGPRQLMTAGCRPPLAPGRAGSEMDGVPDRSGSATPGATRTWVPYWRDRHLRFHLYDQLKSSPDIGDLLRPDRDLLGIARHAEAFTQCRYLAVPLPAKACPAPCSLGSEQFRDLANCARSFPGRPGGRELAEWL